MCAIDEGDGLQGEREEYRTPSVPEPRQASPSVRAAVDSGLKYRSASAPPAIAGPTAHAHSSHNLTKPGLLQGGPCCWRSILEALE